MSTDTAGSTGGRARTPVPAGEWARWAAFTATLRQTLWAAAGLQILTFALAFLLPRKATRAAQDWPAGSHDGETGT